MVAFGRMKYFFFLNSPSVIFIGCENYCLHKQINSFLLYHKNDDNNNCIVFFFFCYFIYKHQSLGYCINVSLSFLKVFTRSELGVHIDKKKYQYDMSFVEEANINPFKKMIRNYKVDFRTVVTFRSVNSTKAPEITRSFS